ncbi:class I SAM-dependent methyltransferase [Rhodoferax antarcticus]|uniref:Methyltransferase domain protein n=1 Tax=Rhodoferax antarcticus ANT.BR TaxID=1111071 RepID=A0A1Q8YGJ5_9BURK|nr:class I SAM-dependent methyltransferase [Rhodoferax antarcticus]APW45626.1 hypothetical protein RA876_03680 [Rhodoferax antarcticus]OLP07113.1 methyltransferase domain protein [Rhodoferax antarcticus ANT.BR]
MTSQHRHCPVCNTDQPKLLLHNQLAAVHDLDMSYQVARCGACGFHYASDLPPDAQYAAYYQAVSKYDAQGSVSALDRQRIAAAVALCQRAGLPKTARIVDIGCGFGVLLAALRDAGWSQVQGIDPAPQSAQVALALFNLTDIRTGWLANAGEVMDLRQADLVCLMAVLEHLPQLHSDLAQLISHMRPGARLLLEVPALEEFRGDAGEPLGELSLEHIQFFSVISLRNLLGRLGAKLLMHEVLTLPSVGSGALFVMAEVGQGGATSTQREDSARMDAYLAGSTVRLARALQCVPDEPFVLYGAGSHSARLIPALQPEQRQCVLAVLDGNRNLHGKQFDSWPVQAPEALVDYPGVPVLISSYRAEKAIARALAAQYENPLVLMYGGVSAAV